MDIGSPKLSKERGTDGAGVYQQGLAEGGATFSRGEGCWYGAGVIYFISTDGGAAEKGQVWSYDPRRERLTMLFESPGAAVLDNPDNITWSPRGGILLCDDGSETPQKLRGLTTSGKIFPFAENQIVLNGEDRRRFSEQGMGRGNLLQRVAIRQHPDSRCYLCDHWAVG